MDLQASHLQSTAHLQRHNWQLRRRAVTVVEVTLAFTLLAIVLAASVRMARVVADHRRSNEDKAIAIQAAQAVAEQVGNIPWDELSADTAGQIQIPGPLASRLPNAKCTTVLTDESKPTSKRVLVRISWTSDGQARTTQLTSWAFPE